MSYGDQWLPEMPPTFTAARYANSREWCCDANPVREMVDRCRSELYTAGELRKALGYTLNTRSLSNDEIIAAVRVTRDAAGRYSHELKDADELRKQLGELFAEGDLSTTRLVEVARACVELREDVLTRWKESGAALLESLDRGDRVKLRVGLSAEATFEQLLDRLDTLTDAEHSDEPPTSVLAALRVALGLEESATASDALRAVRELAQSNERMGSEIGRLQALRSNVATALGVPPIATDDQILEAAEALSRWQVAERTGSHRIRTLLSALGLEELAPFKAVIARVEALTAREKEASEDAKLATELIAFRTKVAHVVGMVATATDDQILECAGACFHAFADLKQLRETVDRLYAFRSDVAAAAGMLPVVSNRPPAEIEAEVVGAVTALAADLALARERDARSSNATSDLGAEIAVALGLTKTATGAAIRDRIAALRRIERDSGEQIAAVQNRRDDRFAKLSERFEALHAEITKQDAELKRMAGLEDSATYADLLFQIDRLRSNDGAALRFEASERRASEARAEKLDGVLREVAAAVGLDRLAEFDAILERVRALVAAYEQARDLASRLAPSADLTFAQALADRDLAVLDARLSRGECDRMARELAKAEAVRDAMKGTEAQLRAHVESLTVQQQGIEEWVDAMCDLLQLDRDNAECSTILEHVAGVSNLLSVIRSALLVDSDDRIVPAIEALKTDLGAAADRIDELRGAVKIAERRAEHRDESPHVVKLEREIARRDLRVQRCEVDIRELMKAIDRLDIVRLGSIRTRVEAIEERLGIDPVEAAAERLKAGG